MSIIKEKHLGRRNFIKSISSATAILLTGNISILSAQEVWGQQSNVVLRFAVASDFHYGQEKTQFDEMVVKIITQINQFHKDSPLLFTVLNGDIIHNEKQLLPIAKQKIDGLLMPYFVTRGNHDMVTGSFWQEVWNTPLNNVREFKEHAIILADSSNEKGEYLSPDLVWLEKELKAFQTKKNVFLFVHIPQIKFTKNCIDTPAFWELIKKYPNIKAVFHGHDHDLDTVFMKESIPFIFDSHAGGNWGTKYNGFRVVELLKDGSLITYIMNPTEKLNLSKI
jgi:3',5'-cyclic AMP phosphodiesterase CpdA